MQGHGASESVLKSIGLEEEIAAALMVEPEEENLKLKVDSDSERSESDSDTQALHTFKFL